MGRGGNKVVDAVMKYGSLDDIDWKRAPGVYQELHGLFGPEVTISLARHLGGTRCHLPHLSSLLISQRDDLIREAFTGGNVRELAERFGLCVRRVYAILDK